MLLDGDGNPIHRVPHQEDIELRNRRLTAAQQESIEQDINRRIDESEKNGELIFCSSWIAGSDWSNTPLAPLYDVCGQDEEVAKLYWGQWCWYALMNRADCFMFERIDHLEPERICGLTYWRVTCS